MRRILASATLASALCAGQAAAVDPNWAVGPYSWSQYGSTVQMMPTSTHVCVLTRVAGDFDGGGEQVKVYQYGGYWFMGGGSQQSGVGGQAWCFAKNAFVANGSARWNSDDASVWASSGSGCYSGQHNGMWWGDATTFLNGIGGKLRSSGDRAQAIQSNGAYTPSALRVDACSSGYLIAFGMSFFAGAPQSGALAKYWGGIYTVDSSYACANDYGVYEVEMAPVNDAMCHFTSIGGGGNWDGGAEAVTIYPKIAGGIERWYMQAHSGYCGTSRKTVAQARCYRRDQR